MENCNFANTNIENDPFKDIYEEEGGPLPPILSTIPPDLEINDEEQEDHSFPSQAKNLIGNGRRKYQARSSIAVAEPREVAAHTHSKHRHHPSKTTYYDDQAYSSYQSASSPSPTNDSNKSPYLASSSPLRGSDSFRTTTQTQPKEKERLKKHISKSKHGRTTDLQRTNSTSSSDVTSPASQRRNTVNQIGYSGRSQSPKQKLAFGPMWLDGAKEDSHDVGSKSNSQSTPDINKHVPRITGNLNNAQQPQAEENTVLSVRRRTIAPIGSLDDQIRHRKHHRQVRSNTLPERSLHNDLKGSSILEKSATIGETISEELKEEVEEGNPIENTAPLKPDSPISPVTKKLLNDISQSKRSDSLPNLQEENCSTKEILSNSYNESGDMKSALKKMRSRLNPGQQMLPQVRSMRSPTEPEFNFKNARERSSTLYSSHAPTDTRKRSGSFGSRMLRRAKSAVGRQNRKDYEDTEGENAVKSFRSEKKTLTFGQKNYRKQVSLDDDMITSTYWRATSPTNEYCMESPTHNQFTSFCEDETLSTRSTATDTDSVSGSHLFPTILMQGDLYRRKRLAWTKVWAVLTTDKVLTMYRSKNDFEKWRQEWIRVQSTLYDSPTSKTLTLGGNYGSSVPTFSPDTELARMDLSGGCDIDSVVQGKKNTTFQLIPRLYLSPTRGVASTLPLEAGLGSIKPVHLMCKNNDECLYWVKALVQINSEDTSYNDLRLRERNIPRQHSDIQIVGKEKLQDNTERQLTHSQRAQEELTGVEKQHITAIKSHKKMNSKSGHRVLLANEQPNFPVRKENALLTGHSASSRSNENVLSSPFSVKSVMGNQHELRFIDDDTETEDHFVISRLRPATDHNENALQPKQWLNTDTVEDFKLNREAEKIGYASQGPAVAGKCVKQNHVEDASIEAKKVSENLKDKGTGQDNDNVEKPAKAEFKKCSITEKINMRKAQIVGGATATKVRSTDALDISRQAAKCTDFQESGANGKTNTLENLKVVREVYRSGGEKKPTETSKTRDKESRREREKKQKGKNNVISDCDVQTTQSLLLRTSDKEERSSSPLADVYSGDKQNISSGIESVKDQQHPYLVKSLRSGKTSDINSQEDCKLSKADNETKPCDFKLAKIPNLRVEPDHNIATVTTSVAEPEAVDRNLVVEPNIKSISNAPKDYKTNQTVSHLTQTEVLAKQERNSIRRIKSRSRAANHIRKQKSLRQQIFRKLGSHILLSSSTPDLNTADSDLDDSPGVPVIEVSTLSTPVTVKLRRHSAFRGRAGHRRASSPAFGSRSLSEGDILEALADEIDGRSMRTFKNVRKISEDDFIETYGVMPKKSGKKSQPTQRHSTYDIKDENGLASFALYDNGLLVQNDYLTNGNANRRRASTSDSSSSDGSAYQASLTNSDPQMREVVVGSRNVSMNKCSSHSDIHRIETTSRRPRSTGSDDSESRSSSATKDESRSSWFSTFTPNFARKGNKSSANATSSKSTAPANRRAVFHMPASQLTSAAHRGYLDRRNKKRQWERFWCVLQDSCLYCYNSPQSEYTQDAVVLRGYDVIADVTNLNKSRFTFRLERNGSPTLYFSSENHQQFLLWAGTLERETSNVFAGSSDNEVLVNSVKISANNNKQEAVAGDEKSKSNETDAVTVLEPYEVQKENLLREVLAQQHKIIEEQKQLQKQNGNATLTAIPDYAARRASKDTVNEKYSRVKEDEEMKMMKCLTHLNRRRNSAQLKVDQITKQLAPKSGRKRRENPQQFAEMEAKLKELEERLALVDKEIQEKQSMRQDVIEKIHQRRDLELLVLEQQESLAIIRKHQARQNRKAFAKQTQPERSGERLTSIDEMSSISDCSSTSSNSLPDPLSLGIESHVQVMSTPLQKRAAAVNNAQVNELDQDSCFHRSSDLDEVMSQGNSSVEGALSDDFRCMSTSSEDAERIINASTRTISSTSTSSVGSVDDHNNISKKTNEISPAILSEIEEFQRFSKETLARLGNK